MNGNEKSNPISELDELAASLKDSEYNRISSEISSIQEILESPELNKNNFIPESVFKEEFLPFFKDFMSNKIDKKDVKNNTLMYKWLALAESPYKEVDVLNMKGEKIFTVPPLYNKDGVNLEHLKPVPFSEIGKETENRSSILWEDGENYLAQRLSSLPKEAFLNPNEVTNDIKRWEDIFKRYENENKKDLPDVNLDNIPKIVKEDLGLITDD